MPENVGVSLWKLFCGNVLVEERGGFKWFNFQTFDIIVQQSLKIYLYLTTVNDASPAASSIKSRIFDAVEVIPWL